MFMFRDFVKLFLVEGSVLGIVLAHRIGGLNQVVPKILVSCTHPRRFFGLKFTRLVLVPNESRILEFLIMV
jgi:hypothetical protein